MFSFTPIRVSIAGVFFALNGMTQQAPVQKPVTPTQIQLQPSTPPDSLLYHALFQRYYMQEHFALHIDASGKKGLDGKPITGDTVRTLLMKEIGLTATEDAIVKAVSIDYVQGFYAYTRQRGQLLGAAMAISPLPPGVSLPVATTKPPPGLTAGTATAGATGVTGGTSTPLTMATITAQLAALRQQHEASITSHVAQIQGAMTPARFEGKINSFIHTTLASQVKYVSGTIKVSR